MARSIYSTESNFKKNLAMIKDNEFKFLQHSNMTLNLYELKNVFTICKRHYLLTWDAIATSYLLTLSRYYRISSSGIFLQNN